MRLIIKNLGVQLIKSFKRADEIWIATALVKDTSLKTLRLNKIKSNFLVGTYLPTEPKALRNLLALQNKGYTNVKVFTKGSFHPKIYMAKKKNKYIAYIGSSNLTNGGMKNNIEVNYFITNKEDISKLKAWFEFNFNENKDAKELNYEFIENYTSKYQKQKYYLDKIKNSNLIFDKNEVNNSEVIMSRQLQFMKNLKTWMKTNEYKQIVKSKKEIIKKYRRYLDYPRYLNIDIRSFISERDLGYTHGLNVPEILHQRKKFVSLVNYLKDEKIIIEKRFCESMQGYFCLNKIGKAIISKILLTIDPKSYCIWNNVSHKTLIHYGFKLPRTNNNGKKYKILLDTMKLILKEAGIKNFAVLDYFLYKYHERKLT